MIKKILIPLLMIAAFYGCGNNEKAQENALLDSVKAVHDKVMGDDDANMKHRMKLKMLLMKRPELKDSVNYYLKKLDDNDNVMMDWMNKFNPDFTGKSHEQVMNYLHTQKKQVEGVDSLMKNESNEVVAFLIRNIRKK